MQKSKNIYKKTKEIKSKYGQKTVQKTHTFDLTNAKVVLKCTSKKRIHLGSFFLLFLRENVIMILLDELYEKLLREFWLLKEDDWIEWIAKDNDFRDDCDKFDGCYFIVKQMPMYPQHPRCQCQIKKLPTAISRKTVKVNCDIKKFEGYIFSDKYDDGKRELFESWGLNIYDSENLQSLYKTQAIEKYCEGEYEYIGTNDYFAKIKIIIEITTIEGKNQKVNTIWKIGRKGELTLITPYSGHSY